MIEFGRVPLSRINRGEKTQFHLGVVKEVSESTLGKTGVHRVDSVVIDSQSTLNPFEGEHTDVLLQVNKTIGRELGGVLKPGQTIELTAVSRKNEETSYFEVARLAILIDIEPGQDYGMN